MANIKGYLAAIGLLDLESLDPNIDLLRKVVKAHLKTFPYQNTQLFLAGTQPVDQRQVPDLSIDSIYKQFITHKQAGYCFQNSELLAWALEELGFTVERYGAKLTSSLSNDVDPAKVKKQIVSHEAIAVTLNNERWLIDTGAADQSIREPLRFKEDCSVAENEEYRTVKAEKSKYFLEKKISQGRWYSMYQLNVKPKTISKIQKYHEGLYKSDEETLIRNIFKLGKVTWDEKDNPKDTKSLVAFKNQPALFRKIKADGTKTDGKIFTKEDFAAKAQKWFNKDLPNEALDKCSFIK